MKPWVPRFCFPNAATRRMLQGSGAGNQGFASNHMMLTAGGSHGHGLDWLAG